VRPSGILATPRMETFPRQRRARRSVGGHGGESGSHSVVNTKRIKEKTSGRSCAVQRQNLSAPATGVGGLTAISGCSVFSHERSEACGRAQKDFATAPRNCAPTFSPLFLWCSQQNAIRFPRHACPRCVVPAFGAGTFPCVAWRECRWAAP
jgi:hypothetical protein